MFAAALLILSASLSDAPGTGTFRGVLQTELFRLGLVKLLTVGPNRSWTCRCRPAPPCSRDRFCRWANGNSGYCSWSRALEVHSCSSIPTGTAPSMPASGSHSLLHVTHLGAAVSGCPCRLRREVSLATSQSNCCWQTAKLPAHGQAVWRAVC